MAKPYPTTVSELAEWMERGWPEVRESTRAMEQFVVLDPTRDDNPRDKKVVFLGQENAGVVRVVHTAYWNGVAKPEGHPLPAGAQKYFSEEHAVRAAWAEYCAVTPPVDFERGLAPLCLIWRTKPECKVRPGGVLAIYSRYSCIWNVPEEGGVFTSSQHLTA